MTINEPNHYARNLKFVSTLFILYWVLGLEPTSDEIRLAFVNYKITNVDMLGYVAHTLLLYVLWGFLLNKKSNSRYIFIQVFRKFILNFNLKIRQDRYLNAAIADFRNQRQQNFERERLKSIDKHEPNTGVGPYQIIIDRYVSNSGHKLYPNVMYLVKYPSTNSDRILDKTNGLVSISLLSWHLWFFVLITPFYYMKFVIQNDHFQDTALPLVIFSLAVLSSVCIYLGIPFPDFK